jgi:hypothetical protein
MNKIWIPILIVPCLLCGCKKDEAAATPSDSAAPKMSTSATPSGDPSAAPSPANSAAAAQVVGTWKIDLEKSTVPGATDKDKAEIAGIKVEFKADGTYLQTGDKTPDTGKWAITDGKLALTSDKPGSNTPPPMAIAADGSTLTAEIPGAEGKPGGAIVFVKA